MPGIHETYLSNMERMQKLHPGAHFEVITRDKNHVLSPSWKILNEYKRRIRGKNFTETVCIFNDYFTSKFLNQLINSEKAKDALLILTELATRMDVFLVCYEKDYPCHRYIIKGVIKERLANERTESV